jgi:DNA recombination protein RmuC
MDKMGAHIDKAQQSFIDARSQLSSGKGSVVRQVEMLRELGAKSAKQLPAGWDNGGEEPRLLRLVGDEPGDLA